MTEQDIFDTVALALVKQGGPSGAVASNGVLFCRYRGEGGRKCAIGHLIPDADYEPSFEGATLSQTTLIRVLAAAGCEGGTLDLLYNLQQAHDSATEPAVMGPGLPWTVPDAEWLLRWAQEMRNVALIWRLSTTVLDAALANRKIQGTQP